MAEKELGKKELVKQLIGEGEHTKAEIAAKLSMSTASVSSQMTYLRWMGNFIVYDEKKILSLVTEEEYKEWQATLQANKKPKITKTPEQLAKQAVKSLAKLKTSLASWELRLDKADENEAIDDMEEFQAEASANIVLLEIKIKRAMAAIAKADVGSTDTEGQGTSEDIENPNEDELL